MASLLDRWRKPTEPAPVELPAEPGDDAPAVEIDPPAPKPKTAVFASETSAAPDGLGIAPAIRKLAELVAHAETQTPVSIGLFGGPGAGKSFALSGLLGDVRALAAAASKAEQTPFVKRLAAAQVDATANEDPAIAVANALYDALCDDASGYARWAESAAYRSGDPQQIVREESERVTDLRRRQDAERQALEEIQGRRARLTENVLYDAAGTQIDSYARKNRSTIEGRLAGFGFANTDPIATYKDLVRDYAENGGVMRRVRMFFHSLWAFNGQLKLIVLAIVFAGLGWLLGQFQLLPIWLTNFLTSVQENFNSFTPVANWIKANGAKFDIAKNAAFIAAAGALAVNIFRALRFLGPIKRGAGLLGADIATRRQDLDNLIQAQGQRVSDIAAEVEIQSKRLEDAQLRADAARATPSARARSPFGDSADGPPQRARNFLSAIAAGVSASNESNAPARIVVAIDNLDALPSEKASAWLQQVKPVLATTGFASIVAVNPHHIAAAKIDDGRGVSFDEGIARIAQVLFRLGGDANVGFGKFVRSMLGETVADKPVAIDASRSALDEPMRPGEAELLASLADLAGDSPRLVKRYVNVYRLLRAGSVTFAPQILALAVQTGARENERQVLEKLLEPLADDDPVPAPEVIDSRIAFALKEATARHAGPLTAGALRAALAEAARYSGRF